MAQDNISNLYKAFSSRYDNFKDENAFRDYVTSATDEQMQSLYDAYSAEYDDFKSVDDMRNYINPTAPSAPSAPKASAKDAPLTEAQKAQAMQFGNQVIAGINSSVQDFSKQMQNMGQYQKQAGLTKYGKPQETTSQFNAQTGKVEKRYIIPSGEVANETEAAFAEHDIKQYMDAQREYMRAEKAQEAIKALPEQVSNLSAEIDDALTQFEAESMGEHIDDVKKNPFTSAMLSTGMDNAENATIVRSKQTAGSSIEREKRHNALITAKNAMENAQRTINEANTNAKRGTFTDWLKSSFMGGAARGFTQSLFDASTWDFGATDVKEGGALLNALNKFDKGEKLTIEEQMMLDAKAVELATDAYFGSEVGRGYKAGQVTAESLPFMIEMCINPASAMGSAATSKMTRYALKRFGKTALKKRAKSYLAGKVATRVLGDIAGSATMAATTGSMRVAGETMNRAKGDIEFGIDDVKGKFVFDGHQEGEDLGTAFKNAYLGTTIENYSEMFGEYFEPVLNPVMGGITKMLSKVSPKAVNNFIENVAASDVAKLVADFEKHAKWNGVFSEYAEEVSGNIMNALIVGDQTFDTDEQTGIFNLDNNIDTFLGVALMGGFMSSAKTLGYRTPKSKARSEMEVADDTALRLFGGNANSWGAIRNTLAFGNEEDMKATIANVLSNDELSKEQKEAVLKYAEKVQNYKGILKGEEASNGEIAQNIADGSATADEVEIAERSEAYNSGATAADPQSRKDIILANKVAPSAETEEAVQGVMDAITDEVEARHKARIRERDQYINKDGGEHRATLKLNDTPVYILDGNVQMTDDGTMVSNEKSDEQIVIFNTLTGKKEFVAPSAILSVDNVLSADDVANELAQIRQNELDAAINDVNGVLPLQLGDIVSVPTKNGIVQGNIIGNDGVNIMVQTADGGQIGTTAQELQNTADQLAIADYKTRNGIEGTNAPTETENAAEGQNDALKYATDTEITFTDEDGTEKSAIVTARGEMQNVDGEYQFVPSENGNVVEYMVAGEGDVRHSSIADLDNVVTGFTPAKVVEDAVANTTETEAPVEEAPVVETPAAETPAPTEPVAETPTEPTTPAEPTEPAQPKMIGNLYLDEEDEPIFDGAKESDIVDYYANNMDTEDALEMIQGSIDGAKEILDGVTKQKPKETKKPKATDYIGKPNAYVKAKNEWQAQNETALAEWQANVDKAQSEVDKWTNIKRRMQSDVGEVSAYDKETDPFADGVDVPQMQVVGTTETETASETAAEPVEDEDDNSPVEYTLDGKSDAFKEIIKLADEVQNRYDNMGDDETDEWYAEYAKKAEELVKSVSDSELDELSEILARNYDDLDVWTFDNYESRQAVKESQRIQEQKKKNAEAIKSIRKQLDALKNAIEGGDKKAIKDAKDVLTKAMLASGIGHQQLREFADMYGLTKRNEPDYALNKALKEICTKVADQLQNTLNDAIENAGIDGVSFDFDGISFWMDASKNSPYKDKIEALDNNERRISEISRRNGGLSYYLNQLTMDNIPMYVEMVKKMLDIPTSTPTAKIQKQIGWIPSAPKTKAEKVAANQLVEHLKGVLGDALVLDKDEMQKELELADKVEKQIVYHGSGTNFDNFDSSHMGEGEGAQVHGYGHYVAVDKNTGKGYAERMNGSLNIEAIKHEINRLEEALPFRRGEAKTEGEQRLAELKAQLEDAGKNYGKFLYEVEIPNQTFSNYLEEESRPLNNQIRLVAYKLSNERVCSLIRDLSWNEDETEQTPLDLFSKTRWQKVMDGTMEFDDEQKGEWLIKWMNAYGVDTGRKFYNKIDQFLPAEIKEQDDYYGNEAKYISQFLSDAGIVGIHYYGERDGECYVIFNDNDLKIVNKTQFLKTKDGEVYGFVKDGKMYLDPSLINMNTPIHEYNHMWDNALMVTNPELWNAWKNLVRNSSEWNKIVNDPAYKDIADDEDLVASELKSRLVGADGEKILKQLADEAMQTGDVVERAEKLSFIDRMKDMLKQMWEATKQWLKDVNFFSDKLSKEQIDGLKVEDFVNKTLNDLANGVNPNQEAIDAIMKRGGKDIVTDKDGDPIAWTEKDGKIQLNAKTFKDWVDAYGNVHAGSLANLTNYLAGKTKGKNATMTKEEAQEIIGGLENMYNTIQEIMRETDADGKPKYKIFGEWQVSDIEVDEKGQAKVTCIVKNSEYTMNVDFSTICKKRKNLDAILNSMVSDGSIDAYDLDPADIAIMNEVIREYGLEVACGLCFVDAKRYAIADWAVTYADPYNMMLNALAGNTELGEMDFAEESNRKSKDADFKPNWKAMEQMMYSNPDIFLTDKKDGIKEIFKDAKLLLEGRIAVKANPKEPRGFDIKRLPANEANPELAKKARHYINANDLISSQGMDGLKQSFPELYAISFRHRGVGKPKSSHTESPYMSQILSMQLFNANRAYAIGGVRNQSFSDFVAHMVFDYMQMFGDLAAKKLPLQAYTKEMAYARLFGLTGAKINMSVLHTISPEAKVRINEKFPYKNNGNISPINAENFDTDEDLRRVGLDDNGNYVRNTESVEVDEALELQDKEGYSDNVGTIVVGLSYEHILKMMTDKAIRMIIPYHKSGLNANVAARVDARYFTDYTNYQNTADKEGTKLEKDYCRFNARMKKLEKKRERGTDEWNAIPVDASVEYIRECESKGDRPRFPQFAYIINDGSTLVKYDENGNPTNVERDANGNTIIRDGYYKLLEDFSVYNHKGEYCPQGDVKWKFPTSVKVGNELKDSPINGQETDINGYIREMLSDEEGYRGLLSEKMQEIKDEIVRRLGKKGKKVQKQIIGEQGASNLDKKEESTIRTDNLNIAKQMTDEGKDAKTIRLATGWEKGADGKWKYEVVDDIASITKALPKMFDHDMNKRSERELAQIAKKDALEKEYDAIKNTGDYNRMQEIRTEWQEAEDERERAMHDRIQGKFLVGDLMGWDSEIASAYPSIMNQKISFYDEPLNTKLGYYDSSKQHLAINRSSIFGDTTDEAIASTILHEIQHAIQSVEGFARGSNINDAKDIMSANNASVVEMAAKKIYDEYNEAVNEYGENADEIYGVIKNMINDGSVYADLKSTFTGSESTAQLGGDNLKVFQEAVQQMSQEEFVDWLKNLSDRANGKGFNDAFKTYLRIAGEVESRNVENRMNMSAEQRRNTLLEETEDVDRVDQIVNGVSGVSYHIIGERGAANLDSELEMSVFGDLLEEAKQMEKDGADNVEIWRKTGWERGTDGKWRTELPDMKIKGGEKKLARQTTLGKVFDADQLFDAYPALKDVGIKKMTLTEFMETDADAMYDPEEDCIKVMLGDDKMITEAVLPTILHEVQHAIQYEEGFATGTSEQKMRWNSNAIVKQLKQQIDNNRDIISNKEQELADKLATERGWSKYMRKKHWNELVEQARTYLRENDDEYDLAWDKFSEAFGRYKAFAYEMGIKLPFQKYSDADPMKVFEVYKAHAGEVEARNVMRRHKLTDEQRNQIPLSGSEDFERDMQIVMGGDGVSMSLVEDAPLKRKLQEEFDGQFVDIKDVIKMLENGEELPKGYTKMYRAMTLIDGELYPPMATKDEAGLVTPIKLGAIEQSDEHPEKAQYKVKGTQTLIPRDAEVRKTDKGYEAKDKKGRWKPIALDENGEPAWYFLLRKDNNTTVPARYNPYLHTSASPLNDQFKSAWNRPNMVVVETAIPLSELTSAYKAEGAKNAVGLVEWKDGVVGRKLANVGKSRRVALSRYDKPLRIVDESESAQRIAEIMDGEDFGIPANTITPKLLAELQKLGVKIEAPENGSNMEWDGGIRFREGAEPIESENFKNWFGDWQNDAENASKVVDKDGKPLVMSHNTDNEFYTFDKERIGTGQGQAYLGVGFNFSRGGSSVYGKNEMQVYLDIKHPMTSNKVTLSKWDVRNIIRELDATTTEKVEQGWGSITDAVNALMDYAEGDLDIYATLGMEYYGDKKNVMEVFKKHGFDGTIEYDKEGRIRNAVVFEPNQIKSATNNNGDYDPNNPDIRYRNDSVANTTETETAKPSREDVDDVTTMMSNEFGVPANVVSEDEAVAMIGDKAKGKKGWFNTKTGEIVVIADNAESVEDVKATIFHEVVGHKGLREIVGDANYEAFCEQVYEHATEDVRRKIADIASKHGWNFNKATDEYLAGLAEKGFEDFDSADRSIWEKLREIVLRAINNFLQTLQLPKWVKLGDNELRYLLWKSRNNLRGDKMSVIDKAQDIVNREDWGLDDLIFSNEKPKSVNDKEYLDAVESGNTEKAEQMIKDAVKSAMPNTKVVDERGEPLVVYHGTDAEFNTFDKSYLGGNTDGNASSPYLAATSHLGFWLSNIKEEWQPIHKGCYLDIKKPYEVNNLVELADAIEYIAEGEELTPTELAEKFVKEEIGDEYDGIIVYSDFEHGNKPSYMVFNPSQIKSADPITYDDNGNVIPLSERFNEGNDDIRFREGEDTEADEVENIFNDQSLGLEERITAAAIKLANNHTEDKMLKQDARNRIGGNLSKLIKAMSVQREFDKTSVKRVADLYKVLMHGGYLDGMGRKELISILSNLKSSVGRQDLTKNINKVMDTMIDCTLKGAMDTMHKLVTIKGSKVDAKGVEIMGSLDVEGQQLIKAFKTLVGSYDAKTITDDVLPRLEDKMQNADNAVAEEGAIEYAAAQMALEYFNNIKASEVEGAELKEELKQFKKSANEAEMERASYREGVALIEGSIRQCRADRVDAYYQLIGRLSNSLRGSLENVKAFKEAEKERVNAIHHFANSDLEGKPAESLRKENDKFAQMFKDIMLAPLSTFEQIMRMLGSKSANGEGYLFNHFVRGLVDCRSKEIKGVRGKFKELDNKVREIFGKDAKKWADLISMEQKAKKHKVRMWDNSQQDYVTKELSLGNLLYIYMVNKMTDGKMKLRKMGISEEDVEGVKNMLDPRLIQLADWLQSDFLVRSRNEYNETHKRMFGASMAAIEDYFPLVMLSDGRVQNVDIDALDKVDTAGATITGSIIKRRKNTLPLDLVNADALNVILDHIAKMEHWNAYAELGRDINALLSYSKFRNRIKNMNTIYGEGTALWNNLKNVSRIAFGTYYNDLNTTERATLKVAQGVTAAKVSFRINTALKQLLSLPAILPELSVGGLMEGLKDPHVPFTWCMENLPIFNERWAGRMSGDPRLMKTRSGWLDWRNNVIELSTRYGMTPNAFVDAVTCSLIARAVYNSKFHQYKKEGFSKEDADHKAKQDASMSFNLTQQSSEGAFLSPLQANKSFFTTMFTIFRNSPMSYTRQVADSIRNLRKYFKKGGRKQMVDFMAKQLGREGLSEEQARKAAERRVDKQWKYDIVRLLTNAYILPALWSIGGNIWYLLSGDDDDEKEKMMDDTAARLMTAPIEGLTGGDVWSNAVSSALLATFTDEKFNKESLTKDIPAASDLYNLSTKVANKKYLEALNDAINIGVQVGFGANPVTLENAIVGLTEFCGNDVDLTNESLIFVMRVLNAPESQTKRLYFDEINISEEEGNKLTPMEIAKRYAAFQVKMGRAVIPFVWNDEGAISKKMEGNYGTKALVKERIGRLGSEEVRKEYEDITKGFEDMKALFKVRNSKTASEADKEEAIKAIEKDIQRAEEYLAFHEADKWLGKIAKAYLESTSPANADLTQKAMLDVRESLVKAMRGKNVINDLNAVTDKVDSYNNQFAEAGIKLK